MADREHEDRVARAFGAVGSSTVVLEHLIAGMDALASLTAKERAEVAVEELQRLAKYARKHHEHLATLHGPENGPKRFAEMTAAVESASSRLWDEARRALSRKADERFAKKFRKLGAR